MKRCFKCLCVKPLDDFYRHGAMADGRLGKCKECTKADVKAHRAQNLDRFKTYDRLRAALPHRVAARKAYEQSSVGAPKAVAAKRHWAERNEEKRRASNAVNNALRRGKLARLPCEVCGHHQAEGHHPHYGLPLVVVWLCDTHHKEVHRMTRDLATAPHLKD